MISLKKKSNATYQVQNEWPSHTMGDTKITARDSKQHLQEFSKPIPNLLMSTPNLPTLRKSIQSRENIYIPISNWPIWWWKNVGEEKGQMTGFPMQLCKREKSIKQFWVISKWVGIPDAKLSSSFYERDIGNGCRKPTNLLPIFLAT